MKFLSFLPKIGLFALFALALFNYSCTKDEVDDPQLTDERQADEIDFRSLGEGKHNRCFQIVFPVTLEFPDGSAVEVNSREEFKQAVRAYHEANPHQKFRPKIRFPFDVELNNGETVTVDNRRQLRRIIQKCLNDRMPRLKKCFKLVYPVSLQFPDGSTRQVNNKRQLRRAFLRWKITHPRSHDSPKIQFPFSVILKNCTEVLIENQDDLDRLRRNCRERIGGNIQKQLIDFLLD